MLNQRFVKLKRTGRKALRFLLCAMLMLQTLWVPNTALAASAFYFRGYGSENITSNTFAYRSNGANVSGTTVTMQADAGEGTAVGLINLNESGHDISASIDLGGLEIDFSTLAGVTQEGTDGTENDIPTVDISFCGSDAGDDEISSVHLAKPDNAVSGGVTLSSGAKIPSGTRSIFIYLNGKNTTGSNTVVFSNTSLVIRDAGAPSCSVDYNRNWTNTDVTVTITASDSDAGLEGIYINDEPVSATSPYTFTVSSNNTSFSVYAKDLAGKQSDVISETVSKIDKTAPGAPASVPLSSSDWSSASVAVLMPALGTSSGAPERYVYQTGTSSWADLKDGFAIAENGYTTIRVAVEDEAGNRSASAEATAKVDKLAPAIGTPAMTSGSGFARVDVTAADQGLSGLKQFAYAAGEQAADYFTTGGTSITGSTFTVNVGGMYTIFASDNAGNTALKTLLVTTAPTLDAISNVSMNEDETQHVSLVAHDAESALSELTVRVSTSDDALLKTIAVNKADSGISLDITPAKNQSGGPVTVTVELEDPSGLVVSKSFTVSVAAVNDAPVAQEDNDITLDEDTSVMIDVLANDSDAADGDTISISSVGNPAHGKTLIVLGKIRYTPNEDYAGPDSFSYTVSDGNGGTAETVVSVLVEQVNDAPVAKNDAATVSEDSIATIDALGNDTDADTEVDAREILSLVSSTAGSHGATEIKDGMIVYTPAKNYNGTDTFTYTMQDRLGLTAEASVTVSVMPESDDPIFISLENEYTIDEDLKNQQIVFEISDVETPLDSVMLQAASLNTALLEQSGISISGLGDSEAQVKLLLSPLADKFGDVEIQLILGDGFNTVERTILVHVQNVNDAPRAANDTVSYTEGAEYVDIAIADLLANDSDIEGNAIFFDGFGTLTSIGTIEKWSDTTLRYTPKQDYDGQDSFTFYVSDGSARTLATCTLKAAGVNDAPTITISQAAYETNEDSLISIPFKVMDKESGAGSLSVIAATSNDAIVTTSGITIVTNEDGTGEIRVQPSADANGTVTLTITVSDGEAQSSESFSLTVQPVQDAPVAVGDKVYVLYCSSRSFSVLSNDHDVDEDTLTVSILEAKLPGTLSYDADTQLFTYVPAIGENGVSTFTYSLWDGKETAIATVTLNVTTVKHAPVITAIDSKYVNEDATIGGIGFAVSDEDTGDTAEITISSSNTALLPENAEHISYTDLGGGEYSITLTPAENQSGSATITVTVQDSTDLTDSTSFTLHVLGQNDAPVANNDSFTIDEDSSLTLTPLANDSDPDGDTIWLASLSTASHGYIESSGNTYTYYPFGDWNGSDTLTYRVSDGRATTQASISITVNPVNDKPIAWDDWRELPLNTAGEHANLKVMGNDDDGDAADVIHMYQIVTQPRYGTVRIEDDESITYTRSTASPEANGADSFVYRIIDREDATGDYSYDDAMVHLGIDFNSALNTYGRSVTCYEDADPFDIDLSIDNPNSVPYALTVNTTTQLGTFTVLDNKTVHFAPAANQYGYANITYTIEQTPGGEKDTGTIWLRVYPVNDLPVIDSAPSSVTMDEDTSGGSTFDVTFHDGDCADQYLYFYVYTQSASTSAPIPFQAHYTVSRAGGDARVTVTTSANVNGTGKIVVGVSDGMNCDEKVIDLTVSPVDDAPVVKNEARTIYEDSSVTFASPGSDSEADGDTAKETILTADKPLHGTATIKPNHTILYVPNADFFGNDEFYVTITDQTEAALSSRAKVTITVTPINDQPEIKDLGYYQSTLEDTAKDVTLTVSDVDSDLTGSGSYELTSGNQALVKNENITISHVSGNQMKIHLVPEENANGTVLINIVASDGSLTAEGEFELKIIPVNDIPVAENDAASVDEAVSTGAESTPPKTIKTFSLLANDSDVEDGKPKIVSITDVVKCTVTNLGNGSVTVSADGDISGNVSFTYTVMDKAGATSSATAVVTINPVNDPPRAKDDPVTINEDAQPTISVLSNDSDPEGDTLLITEVSTPAHGTAKINGTKVDYTPAKDYNGSDSFTYTVSDGNGGTASATVRLTIKPVNDAPTIAKHASNPDDWTMDEDTTAPFNFVVADAESAVSGLIIRITSLDEAIIKTSQIALTTDEAGYKTISVTPVLNAHGTARIKFWVSDGLLYTEAIYPITIASVNDAPVVTAAKQETKEDVYLYASVSATDADGDDLTFSKASDPSHGTVLVSANGTYVYTPAKDFNGDDSFIICADDGNTINHVGFATVYITVTPDGDAPTAGDDSIEIDEDTATVIPVLENDSDPDADYGDEISIYRISKPAHGTAAIAAGGILYTPNEDYNGTDSFTYTIADKDGKTDTAGVSVLILPVNDTPRGGDDTATVLEDHSVTIDAVANDDVDETTNPDAENVTITAVDDPAHGTAAADTDGKTITYTPDENWFSPAGSPEVFYYTAKDSGGKTARFAVSVTVNSVNDLPVITPGDLPDIETNEDTTTSAVTFTVKDVETAAGALTVNVTHNNSTLLPAITVTPNASGECSFTVLPKANKVGNATITVTVTDANGGQDSDTFVLNVIQVNDLPDATNDAFSVSENSTKLVNVLLNDDVDTLAGNGGDTLTLLSVTQPQYGTATIENNQVRYAPNAAREIGTNYTDEFTYKMMDGKNNEDTATVTATVVVVNDAPYMSAISNVTGIYEDAPNGTGEIPFTVTDEEDDDDTLSISVSSSNTTLFPAFKITVTNPAEGAASDRTVKVVPAANQYGTGNITLTVQDSGKLTYSRTFSVTVTSVNDIPENGNKSFTVVEDVEKQLDVLKDIDPDYATVPADLSVTSIVSNPSHGTARVAADGKSVYYKTAQDSNEPDSFQYSIHDAYGSADYTFTASITVTPVNDAPVIKYQGSASYEIYEGTSKNDIPFTVEDVDNVTDASGTKPVEVTLSAKSSNSILLKYGINIDTLTGNNRNIDLKPYLKWNGTTTVTITASDPGGLKSTASFELIVNNLNDTPVAVNDTGTIPEDATTSVDVLENDTDNDLLTNPDLESLRVNTVTNDDPNATIVAASDGKSVLVTPKANYNGPVSFSYTAADASGAVSNSATVTLTVSQVNDAPVVTNDAATTAEDTPKDILVLDNDSDIDKDTQLNANPGAESISVLVGESGLTAPSHGSVTTNGTKITYTPSKDYNGTDTFNYYCYDGDERVKGTVTMTITQVNDNPIAVADTATTNEDTATAAIDVMANDTDVDTDSALNQYELLTRDKFWISSSWVSNASNGSVDYSNNKIVFTPAANWFGTAQVYYSVQDGYGASCIGSLRVTVNPVNDLPVFDTSPQDLTLSEDGANGTTGVVVSDVETAAASLSVTVTNSSNPTLIATSDVTVSAGGGGARTISVNPKNDQNGSAVITLKVDDLTGGTRTVTFNVSVSSVNDDPVADNKTLNISEDAALQTIAKSSVTSDADITTNGDELTLSIKTPAQHGTASIDANGNITYIPNANFNGTDSFVYTATDKDKASDDGTVSVNISQVNDAPVVTNDAATTAEDMPKDILVLDNDSDIDKDTQLNANPGAESISVLVGESGLTAPSHGSVTTNGTKITYTPSKDYNGTDTFNYYCYDGDERVKGTVTMTITQVNDNPIAVADSGSTGEDKPISINVISNDTDVDTDSTLNKNALHALSDLAIDSYSISGAAHGTVGQNGNSIEYDPEADFYGTQVIQYVLKDGHGGTSLGTLTIEVGSENDAPVAVDDEMSAAEDHAASVNVLSNDTDVDTGDTKAFVGFTKSTSGLPGTFTTNANGNVTFTPNANYNGSFSIDYQMRDAGGLTSTAKLTITITPVNDKPTAGGADVETDEDTQKAIDVSGLIADADILTNADELTVTVSTAGEPKHGDILVSGKTITYTPDENYNGADEIVYTATDKDGEKASGTLRITVKPVNDAPVAVNDAKTTKEDTASDILALENDSDIDTDAALNQTPAAAPSIESVTNGAHGKATTNGTKITYTPDENFNGIDEISYVLTDGQLTDTAKISITITQVNDGIQAVNDTATTDDEDTVSVDVLANDTDIDTDSAKNGNALHLRNDFSITAVSAPSHGAAKIVSGKIEYTPEDRFAGEDSFTYTVSDGHGSVSTARVTVTVRSVNDAPEIIVVSSPKEGDKAGTGSKITVEWTGFDIDGDTLTYLLEYLDGKTWKLAADKLSDQKYQFAVPDDLASTNGLKFRVNARDTELTSEYGYSGAMILDKDAPAGTVVTMRTADGRAYTEGVWTNQTVTVTASSASDVSKVTYYYAMDGGTSAAGTQMDVETGEHKVLIRSADEYGNAADVGGYLARVDKQQPATPDISESVRGERLMLTFAFHADPGGSGNNKLTLPDGSTVNAADKPAYAVTKNGKYSFTLSDVAGNRKAFTYTVGTVDTSKPAITLNSGDYRVGKATTDSIRAALTFTDADSEIVSRGYLISTSSTAGGAYRAYSGALTLSNTGTYYIHAMAKNAFGLTALETFGPFIIEKAADPAVSPAPAPEKGDVVVEKEDIDEIPGEAVSIRLPGQEWNDSLTLKDVEPGEYLVEVLDENGDVHNVRVRVTVQDIFSRSIRSMRDQVTPAAIATAVGCLLAIGLLILLAAGSNVTVMVRNSWGESDQTLRTMRRIRMRKKEFIIRLEEKQVSGGEYAIVRLSRPLSKHMRGNTVVIILAGEEVLREQVADDIDEAFERRISIR